MAVANTLEQKTRQLDLVMALDKARDMAAIDRDPAAMFRTIAELLCQHFKAEASAILLLSEEINHNGESVEIIVTGGMTEEVALKLSRLTMKLSAPDHIPNSHWPHTIGMQIIMDHANIALGALVLARNDPPFTQIEAELLEIAESQIDSAVIQARKSWELANRNRQLEAIYQIDRMRDESQGENELINGFTSVLTEYFRAELCMIILSHIDSGELVLRGIVDKGNLPIEAIETIRRLSGTISIPQAIQTPTGIGDLNLLAAPLVVSGVQLGSVVVGRESAFTGADHRLLFAMMSQMDSAIAHSRVTQQLFQRNKELETIYKIDQIRDGELDFDAMMQQVLAELCQAVNSELGYLMLYTASEEERLELKASTVEGVLTSPVYYNAIIRVSREALEKGEAIYSNRPDGAVRSIVAIPLILNDKVIGVFGTLNSSNPRGFSAEDRRILTAITSQVDTAIFERLEQRRMRRVLSRSVDPKVLEQMLQLADNTVLTGERVVLSVVFCDLRGSTEWAERTEPEQLVSSLNAFLGRMTGVIFKNGGTLDKFVGDEVIALFGSPVYMPDHALQAARCALDMKDAHARLQAELRQQGLELPDMGIGLASGETIAGEFGPPIRTDFTAVGKLMNLGSRLCSSAHAGQIIISTGTQQMLAQQCKSTRLEPANLKGIGDVTAYELVELIS